MLGRALSTEQPEFTALLSLATFFGLVSKKNTSSARSVFAPVAGEPGASRSKNLLENAMKQMLVYRHTPRLLGEARELGISSADQDNQHQLNQSRGLFMRCSLQEPCSFS